jgi:hypothetical protein
MSSLTCLDLCDPFGIGRRRGSRLDLAPPARRRIEPTQ